MISLDERRKSDMIIQKLHSKKITKTKNRIDAKRAWNKQKVGLMSLGEKNLFQEAKQITIKQTEQTITEKENLKDSLVFIGLFIGSLVLL